MLLSFTIFVLIVVLFIIFLFFYSIVIHRELCVWSSAYSSIHLSILMISFCICIKDPALDRGICGPLSVCVVSEGTISPLISGADDGTLIVGSITPNKAFNFTEYTTVNVLKFRTL